MNELDNEIWKYISKHLSGTCSPEEKKNLKKWMNQDPANRQIVRDLERIWEQAPGEDFEVSTHDAWLEFEKSQLRNKGAGKRSSRYFKKGNGRSTFLKVAAVFFLVAATAFISWQYFEPMFGTPEMQEFSTKQGERSELTLPDGSTVMVNVASSLRYPEKFTGSKREVYLDGEAYFEVESNASKPFTVHTENSAIEVLGTKFNVQAWKEDVSARIGVREGKVSVVGAKEKGKKVLLRKNQFTKVKDGKPTAIQRVDMNNLLMWINGGLYFDKVPFDAAIRRIERKFDVQIIIEDSGLDEVPFTGTFKNAELTEVLDLVSVSMGIQYSLEGSEVTFHE